MTKYRHRVERRREPQGQPLPKEVVATGPREYRDRFGVEMVCVWDGRRSDPPLRELSVNVLK